MPLYILNILYVSAVYTKNIDQILKKNEYSLRNKRHVPPIRNGRNSPQKLSLESLLEGYLLKNDEMDAQIQEKAKEIQSLKQELLQFRNGTTEKQGYRTDPEKDLKIL